MTADCLPDLATIPAGRGRVASVRTGQHLRLINTHGTQVVDTWAFACPGTSEFLSMEHCREVRRKIGFGVGDMLVTNRYRPILRIVADTSPGGHDTLIGACNRQMYETAGHGDGHANCADNLDAALATMDLEVAVTPSPWNLFMLAPVLDGGHIEFRRPESRPGDYVEVAAEIDCVVVFSACPDDVYPTNGGDGRTVDAHFMIFDPISGRETEGGRT